LKTQSTKQPKDSKENASIPKQYTRLERELKTELDRLKIKVGMGFEVNVKWLPGIVKYKNGKQLSEEVIGNTIFIYVEELAKAKYLLAHGFSEWLLNKHTKRYRQLINKLIELFEQMQYEEKEEVIEAMTRLLATDTHSKI